MFNSVVTQCKLLFLCHNFALFNFILFKYTLSLHVWVMLMVFFNAFKYMERKKFVIVLLFNLIAVSFLKSAFLFRYLFTLASVSLSHCSYFTVFFIWHSSNFVHWQKSQSQISAVKIRDCWHSSVSVGDSVMFHLHQTSETSLVEIKWDYERIIRKHPVSLSVKFVLKLKSHKRHMRES